MSNNTLNDFESETCVYDGDGDGDVRVVSDF